MKIYVGANVDVKILVVGVNVGVKIHVLGVNVGVEFLESVNFLDLGVDLGVDLLD